MNFLIDAQLSRRLVQHLRVAGHDAMHPAKTDGGTGLTDPPTELSRRQLPRQHDLIMRRLYSARFPSS